MALAYYTWTEITTEVRKREPDPSKKIPLKMKDFKPQDFDTVENFICGNSKFMFESVMDYDDYKYGDNPFKIGS